jgi:hypothetical protein
MKFIFTKQKRNKAYLQSKSQYSPFLNSSLKITQYVIRLRNKQEYLIESTFKEDYKKYYEPETQFNDFHNGWFPWGRERAQNKLNVLLFKSVITNPHNLV